MKKKYYLFNLNINFMNILAFVILIALWILTINIKGGEFFLNSLTTTTFILYIVIMITHELLHGFSYYIHGGEKDKIVFGAALEKGILYCLCKQNISRKNILWSSMYPLIFIGVITYIIGLIFNLPILAMLSMLNLSGCGGDICTFLYISRLNKNIEFSETDDPTVFAIYADYDVSKVKHIGLKYKEDAETIERNDLTKIKISKPSKIIFIVLIIIIIMNILMECLI